MTASPPTSAGAAGTAPAGYEELCLYIDGEFIAGGRATGGVINPGNGETIAQLPHASRADLDRALAAAERAFASWRHSSPLERSRILRKVAERARSIRNSNDLFKPDRPWVNPTPPHGPGLAHPSTA